MARKLSSFLGKFDYAEPRILSNNAGSNLNSYEGGRLLYREEEDQAKISMENPMGQQFKYNNNTVSDDYSSEYTPFINGKKTMGIYLGTSKYKDWRSKSNNGLWDVSPNVVLIPNNQTLEMAFSYQLNDGVDTGSVLDKIKGGLNKVVEVTKVVSSVVEAAHTLTADNVISNIADGSTVKSTGYIYEYEGYKTFKDLSTFAFGDSISFNFSFGQAGLFSGLEEVVKPIFALMHLFTPVGSSDDYSRIVLPYPTEAAQLMNKLASIVGGASGVGQKIKSVAGVEVTENNDGVLANGKEIAGVIAEKLDDINISIKSTLSANNRAASESGEYKNIYLVYGNFRIGPCQATSFRCSFDTSNLDEFGWPVSGSFTIGGLTSNRKATSSALKSTILTDNPSITK